MKKIKLLLCIMILGMLTLGMVSCKGADTPKDDEEVLTNNESDAEEQPEVYLLQYNTNGGEPIPPQEVKYGEAFTLATPVREGYTFEGWYLGPAKFSDGIWEYTVNMTVDAKWSESPQ